jgi:helicase
LKYELPEGHALSDAVIQKLCSFSDGFAITDAQYEALNNGVGRGESLLVASPTSTGKTLIGLLGIASSLELSANAVYLVTHRALAQQKMEDFRGQLLDGFLGGDPASLVLATGDYVRDSSGNDVGDPLGARLLVATYEKYLALLSASGIPSDMRNTTIVCDEIQIIADETRGQSVEVLLSLLRKVGWRQFIGLSAVLTSKDASELSDWLGISLVNCPLREKHIQYCCHTQSGVAVLDTSRPEVLPARVAYKGKPTLDASAIVRYILEHEKGSLPIIVFCMTVKDTYKLAEQLVGEPDKGQALLDFDDLPGTFANEFLSRSMAKRVAIHNADLTDDERRVVETSLLERKVDVVFATSTLAAGVNFPLGSAVFASYERYNFSRKVYLPIEQSDFHNMAGRVGRMGYDGLSGKVFFVAKSVYDEKTALQYLNLDAMTAVKARISPDRFNLLALQLVSSGLCASKFEVSELILGTFSSIRELESNPKSHDQWPGKISAAIDSLVEAGYLLSADSGVLSVTPVGKAVGLSGLTPETSSFVLDYFSRKSGDLIECLPTSVSPGDLDKLAFLVLSSALSSPEFVPMNGKSETRQLHWTLDKDFLFNADVYSDSLCERVWRANVKPVNAAHICLQWMKGAALRDLERLLPDLRAGAIRELIRNVVWVLQGVSAILTSVVDKRMPRELLPSVIALRGANLDELSKLPRVIRRFTSRLNVGLPDNALWLTELNIVGGNFKLSREEILSIYHAGYSRPESLMLGSAEADEVRNKVFEKARPSPVVKSNWLRDSVREWKKESRKAYSERHQRRAKKCPNVDLVKGYYESLGDNFEKSFEAVLDVLKIEYVKVDGSGVTGAPDYLLKLADSPGVVVELKSKQNDKLVNYNEATEVLAASEIHGFKEYFCVTLCHPGVDPSVPLTIAGCGRLSVIESGDLAEALLRLCEGKLTQSQLWQWLTTPGQALVDDLPFIEYS